MAMHEKNRPNPLSGQRSASSSARRGRMSKGTMIRLIVMSLVLVMAMSVAWKLRSDRQDMAYSTESTGLMGLSLFSRTLSDLGYRTRQTLEPPDTLTGNALRCFALNAANAGSSDVGNRILDSTGPGVGVLLLVPSARAPTWDFKGAGFVREPRKDDGKTDSGLDGETMESDTAGVGTGTDSEELPLNETWRRKDGAVIVMASLDSLVNLVIADDATEAYRLLEQIHPLMAGRGIVYDEYFLHWTPRDSSLWLDMPLWLKFLLAQLLLGGAVFVLHAGRRFGKARKYSEEEEPGEDMYPKAVGELQMRARHWGTALDAHWTRFLLNFGRSLAAGRRVNGENWLPFWLSEIGTGSGAARKLGALMERMRLEPDDILGGRYGRKAAMQAKEAILLMGELESILEKRGKNRGKQRNPQHP